MPQVASTDAYWAMKRRDREAQNSPGDRYEAIHQPRNNPTGFFIAFFAVVIGFALIWHIWWIAIIGLLGALTVGLILAWRTDGEIEISAEAIAASEKMLMAKEITA
jgi:cytochrome o ubiquinol oxidase subunit 1